LTSTRGLPIISSVLGPVTQSRGVGPNRRRNVPGIVRSSVVNPPEKALIKQILTYGVLFSALIAGCGEDVVGPGNIARPLVGNYGLESRTINTSIQTDSGSMEERFKLVPPQVGGRLRLSADGRYGQVDTTVISDSTTVRVQNGHWSVLDNVFFFVTDNDRESQDRFTFDGSRLVRISEAFRHSSGRLSSFTDVWLKEQTGSSSADE